MNKRVNPLVEALKAERKRLGLTQTEVASLLGIPQSTIGRIEAGIMSPTLESVTSIASLFGKKILLSPTERKTEDPYSQFPIFESARFLLREVEESDLSDLLEVYSDPLSWPYFNSDNCHGDDFHYLTAERMLRAIEFWNFSYQNRHFVRWTIADRRTGKAIGTIEAFHRKADEEAPECALMRLDLRHDYEESPYVTSILSLVIEELYPLFGTENILTKAFDKDGPRFQSLLRLGFGAKCVSIIGDRNERYTGYVCRKKADFS